MPQPFTLRRDDIVVLIFPFVRSIYNRSDSQLESQHISVTTTTFAVTWDR